MPVLSKLIGGELEPSRASVSKYLLGKYWSR